MDVSLSGPNDAWANRCSQRREMVRKDSQKSEKTPGRYELLLHVMNCFVKN